MDSLHSSVSTSSEEIVVNDSSSASEEIAVSDDVSAKYVEEIVAYEHNDESEAIKIKLFDYFNFFFRTYHKIEKCASEVYTPPLFELVQAEIFAGMWYCQIETKSLLEGSEVSVIRETKFVDALMEKRKAKLKEKAKKGGKNKESISDYQ
ncbi:hypothetical protein CTI12_AA342330 [Artemisia annua]|uniref:Uncharacterized protein n=1 Tax=Artemisia annua TaxID=35608 RepID=A0A2U1MTT4_ARTAN|nr:hypothetical protein CTI12_AA342330 [Artemisia annua]